LICNLDLNCICFKIYGRGSGRDCRLHVQRLNEMHMKEKSLENQNFPFQEECIDSVTSVSYVLEDKVGSNGELLCISVDLN
jgi:hypothetical protein